MSGEKTGWAARGKVKEMKNYAELGLQVGRLVDQKQKEYGDSYHQAAKVLAVLYPNGVPPEQ